MAKQGKSKTASFTALDDNYFGGQSDGGRGGAASAFLLRDIQRKAYLLYELLWNMEANDAESNKPSGLGHNHDGLNSIFIGNTVAAQTRQVFESGEAFNILDAQSWSDKNRWMEPIAVCRNIGRIGANSPTLDRLYFGPGANGARIYILWAAAARPLGGEWVPVTSGEAVFEASCVNTGLSVSRSFSCASSSPFVKWSELTLSEPLEVEPQAMNGINISVTANPAGESGDILIYGYVITEARK